MKLQIVKLRPEHAAITPYLRQQDLDEIHEATDLSPELAVAYSIAHSERGYTALIDDIPCAVFGVAQGVIWLVGTDEITHHPVTFLRVSRKIFPQLSHGYPVLHNYVHEANTLSLRWLQWLGFHVDPSVNHFHYVYFLNKEV